jgi:glycosyltransferase involved in cell wall biosynthesis
VTNEAPVRRVLQVHTRYRNAGGEDQVVEAERRLLEGAGVDVRQVLFDNADLRESRSVVGDVRLASSAIWSRAAERRVRAEVAAHRPQVMHVHNTFAAASPSVYAAASAHGVPIVQTLHNYRLVCPAATAFRDGHACTDCVGRLLPWPAVAHRCVRGSVAQSAVATATISVHRALGTFNRRIGTFVALTSFQRQLMVDGGLPARRIRVIPNFLEPDPGLGGDDRDGVAFVGRLAEEKGIVALLGAAAREPGVVRVIGDGPRAPLVEQAAKGGHVEYLGPLEPSAVRDEMRRAAALVVPSTCFEGFPMVVVEAYATGTPVIASRLGSLAEIVEDGVTGLLVTPGDATELARSVRWAVDHPEAMREMGATARRRYESRFRGPSHLAALVDAYQAASVGAARVAHA